MKRAIGALMVSRSVSGSPSSLLTDINSYWKLDEASGNAIDSVSAFTGTINGDVTNNVAGKINTAFQFGSGTGFLNCSTIFSSSVFSFSAWVYRNATGILFLVIGGSTGAGAVGFEIDTDDIIKLVKEGYGGLYQGLTPVPATTWTHIAVTYDAAGLVQIYLNGTLDDSGTDLQTLSWGDITIGRFNAASCDGRIDEVGIWSRVLTGAEITTLYNGGAGLSYPF